MESRPYQLECEGVLPGPGIRVLDCTLQHISEGGTVPLEWWLTEK